MWRCTTSRYASAAASRCAAQTAPVPLAHRLCVSGSYPARDDVGRELTHVLQVVCASRFEQVAVTQTPICRGRDLNTARQTRVRHPLRRAHRFPPQVIRTLSPSHRTTDDHTCINAKTELHTGVDVREQAHTAFLKVQRYIRKDSDAVVRIVIESGCTHKLSVHNL